MGVIIEPVDGQNQERLTVVGQLFRTYAQSLDFDFTDFQDLDAELAALPGCYAAPAGCLFLARDTELETGPWAGCIALRPLEFGACEMKRLYVGPNYRGIGLGRRLVETLLTAAQEKGYTCMKLDTDASMVAAIALYESLGFTPTEPYCHNPLPGARFYACDLQALPRTVAP